MEMQQESTINQQERMAADLQRQRQYIAQQQYYAYKQNITMQLINMLQYIDPFEVVKTINQHGIYTLQLEPQEKSYMANLILQLFSSPDNDFTLENWQEFLRVLNNAVGTTNSMQMMQIGRGGMNYNQYGMMYGGYPNMMGMGQPMGNYGYGNPMYGGMSNYYGGQFGMMGGPSPIPQPNLNQQKTKPDNTEPDNTAAAIAQCKQIFANLIYQCDPIIFINYLLQENYEPKISNNDACVSVLRQLIGNSIWRAQDNVIQIIYYVVNYLYNSEYQRKMRDGTKPQMNQYGGMDPMGGMGNPMMYGGAPNMGMGMGMGQPMGNFGNPMYGGYGYPNQNMGPQMGNFGNHMYGGAPNMGMGFGMAPPPNGMGASMPGMYGNGFYGGGVGGSFMGDHNPSYANQQSPLPMW